jgi:hypothetical protein
MLQCEWKAPPAGDPYPDRKHVLTTPLVADLPNDSGAAAEIVIVASNDSTGGGGSATSAVIRILNGQTCAQDEVIADSLGVRDPAPPAIADLDRDGKLEIVARMNDGTVAAFHWDDAQKKYVKWWRQGMLSGGGGGHGKGGGGGNDWAGVSIYDLDDDGFPEVVAQGGLVFDGRTGTPLNPTQTNVTLSGDPAVGDVDGDFKPELLAGNGVFRWDATSKSWVMAYQVASGGVFLAYADFGTPGATPADFNAKALDGVAEIVATGNGSVGIYTLAGQQIMTAAVDRGGPPTIGDYDRDGFPEFAVADGQFFRVFDLKCKGMPMGCSGNYIRWAQPSQDQTSGQTGSTTFDFEADGKQEAIYADECFVRIYEGASGSVLFSAWRSSCTWWEYPVAADVNKDTHTKIVVNSNPNCSVNCPLIDPIDPGMRCLTNDDCFSHTCDAGFCRCTTDEQCGEIMTAMDAGLRPGAVLGGLRCEPTLPGTAGAGNVCRMTHPQIGSRDDSDRVYSGVRVLRDRLDRWASSRPLWNQHAYNITHINDDGTVPKTSEWKQNFKEKGLNNFRANVQGPGGVDDQPDITGALDKTGVCSSRGSTVTLTGKVCNRGYRVVGAAMPATFYLGPVADKKILCVSYTSGPVPIGDACLPVSCDVTATVPPGSTITMVVNDDGAGHATTVECDATNDTDGVVIDACTQIN